MISTIGLPLPSVAALADQREQAPLERRLSRSRSTHFTVYFEGPSDELIARRVLDHLEAAYLRIGDLLRTYPDGPITVVLYTLEQFTDATRLPEWTIAAYDGRIHLPVRGAPQQRERLERVLSHEFVHAVVATLGGRQVPTWLDEGLATELQRGGAQDFEAVLAATPARPRLSTLHDGFIDLDTREARVAYALSALAVRRMLQMRGGSAIVSLLRDLGRGTPFGTAFNRHMAMGYEDFQTMMTR
jgi:hypothetical protein